VAKKELNEILESLGPRKRAFDVLRVLIEDGDFDMALTIATKLRMDLDQVIAEIERLSGRPVTGRVSPASLDAPPPARGHLGDDDSPGRFELWVERFIDGSWRLISHPRELARTLWAMRGRIAALLAAILLSYTAYRAYDRIFLGGYGLTGEYYLDTDLKTLFNKRLDHTVDFRWLRRPPLPQYRSENFSIRWTGYVRVDTADTYEFYTISDDGVRLWVDGQQLIDNWTIHGGALDKGEIKLTPGYHPIKLEYYQGSGDMVIKLEWKRPGDRQKKVIPARYLTPEIPVD
jgi:hypothetical protein